MTPRLATTLLLSALCFTVQAQAQFATPEQAIKYRQGAFSVMGAHFSRIAMMAQGIQPYDAKVAQENAELVSSLAKLPFTAFGTGTEKGAPNRAKDDIWKEAAKFKGFTDRMLIEVGRLDAAAKTGDVEAVKTAAGNLGKSCKACHDDFRGSKRE
jgi:cytochrome c556